MKRLLATRAQAAHELTVGRAASKEQEARTFTSSPYEAKSVSQNT